MQDSHSHLSRTTAGRAPRPPRLILQAVQVGDAVRGELTSFVRAAFERKHAPRSGREAADRGRQAEIAALKAKALDRAG